MFFSAVVVLVPLLSHLVQGTSPCEDREWYNRLENKCQSCRVCPSTFWESAPCAELHDTMCVDLVAIAKSVHPRKEEYRRWHEREGKDRDYMSAFQEIQTTNSERLQNNWNQKLLAGLCVSFVSLVVFALMMALKCRRKLASRESKAIARARLFSRDRLNTTEYMNNLATVDRRLAMDEILEKKKRAVFEPQLLSENVYSDEVFVDISGLPRSMRCNAESEDVDNRRCLLQAQERQ